MRELPQPFFEAVRRACSPATWSRGVDFVRADAVVGESSADDEVVFRITTRGGMISSRVTLFPEDLEWECECSSREAACEHVAAALIAWHRSREQGEALPASRRHPGRVAYRFERTPGGLAFQRVIVVDGEEAPLQSTLAAVAAGRVDGPQFMATQEDLAVELVLGTHRRGVLPGPLVSKLFSRLARCTEIQLDGLPVRVESEPLLPRAVLADQDEGYRLTLEDEPAVSEKFANGVALCGDVLRAVGQAELTGRERYELTGGRRFGPEAIAELVTDVLPSLRKRIPVEIRTRRLPATIAVTPRLALEVGREGDQLSVLASLVYGDPPHARIDAGRLVHLAGPVPLRDELAERRLVRRLQGELGLVPGVRAFFGGEQAVAFNARLDRWRGSIRGSAREQFRLAPPLTARLALDPDGFDLFFDSEQEAGERAPGAGGRRSVDAGTVLRAWREGASLVPLTGGGWAPLPADWLRRFGNRVADLLAARDENGGLPRCCQIDLALLCEDLDQPPPPECGRLRDLLEDFEGIPQAVLPDDLATPLRSYQRQGLDWLVFLREAGLGAMLADDMGLGKTLQALCALRGRTLVVCPTSVLHNWADEISRHRPGLSYAVFHGLRRELDPHVDVTLTTYSILRLDAERLAGEAWDTVVLDEAQNVKNPDSQVAAAAYRLQAGFRLTLTGTPVENRLEELWSQFHFINRGLLGGRRDFQDRYAEPIARGDAETAARLRARIRPFLLRRLKREVAAELPPRTDMVLYCELTPDEREVYDSIHAATLREVVQRLDSGAGILAALEALLRLRQAACHSALIPGQAADRSSKLALLLESLESVIAEGHKALVFSQWTSLLDLVEPHLAASAIEHVRLDGATRDRAGVVRRFQAPDGPPLLLVSLKAGGTGLNLTAADHVFLLDPWWNPAVEDQAADRAHRIGQERPVMVYRLVASDTVEERIMALQQRKRALAEAALEGGGGGAGLTREDLLDLLG